MSRLDDKVLPVLAAKLRGPRRSPLRRLDQRFVDDGPLAIVRDVPQLGFAVIGAVFLAGTISVAAQRTGESNDGTGQDAVATGQGGTAPSSQRLGAVPGDQVSAYLARAATSLGSSGGGTRLALVSLSRYVTPSQVVSLLQGVTTVRVYVRDPAAGVDAARLSTDVTDLPSDLTTYFRTVASGRTAASTAYKGYADSTTDDAASLADFRALQQASAREGVDYAAACACVYAVVVDADKDALTALRGRDGVRTIERAGSGAELSALAIDPLLPEDTGSVRASDAPTTIAP